jgi:hypothetical protein
MDLNVTYTYVFKHVWRSLSNLVVIFLLPDLIIFSSLQNIFQNRSTYYKINYYLRNLQVESISMSMKVLRFRKMIEQIRVKTETRKKSSNRVSKELFSKMSSIGKFIFVYHVKE